MKGRSRQRLKGHTIVERGWGYQLVWRDGSQVLLRNDVPGGSGRAVCSCGAYSPVLPSQTKRTNWMREDHKPEVIERMEEGS